MRMKLKYALPLAQMALAVALIWWHHWELARMRHPAGVTGPFTLLVLINAPAAMVRMLWFNYVDDPWDEMLLVASIGVFWYLVGLILDYWQRQDTFLLLTWKPIRVAADLALIALGPYFIWLLRRVDVADMPWQWEAPALACVFGWLLGPAFIFGRDLIQCIRSKGSPPTIAALKC
jgi:hypothetical protein